MVERVCKYCGVQFEGGCQSKVCPTCMSIQRAKGGKATWDKMSSDDRKARVKKIVEASKENRKKNMKEINKKRLASWYKWYNGLDAITKQEIWKKKYDAREKKRKERGKVKRVVNGKYYTKNDKVFIVGFSKYTREISHILKSKICKYCGKGYYNRHMGKDFCSKKCYEKYRTEIGWIGTHKCKMCGKEFKPRRQKNSTYCSVQCANRDREINHKVISDVNLSWGKWLEGLGYTPFYEFPLGNLSYDIKIGNNILIEINPTAFHNSTYSPYGQKYIKKRMYHYNKTHYAIDNGYKCINIRDWTTKYEILDMINKDFVYEGEPNLHWCNRKTGELYDSKIKNKYIVGLYDSGNIKFI